MTKPIGILGGTFDPVHHGHLRLALESLNRADLDHVRLVPLYTPPHRDQTFAAPAQRREMLRLAIGNADGLILEDCELEREGVSYTVDTLREIGAKLPGRHLCLIMGMDALYTLNTWHQWQAIPETANIIVVERPGDDTPSPPPEVAILLETAATRDPGVLRETAAGAILRITIPVLDISSTRLRQMFARGNDPHFLLPSPVLDYIHQEQLYMSQLT